MTALDDLQHLFRPHQSNCIDLAKAFQKVLKESHLTQHELAARIGIKRSTLTNYLRLLSLPADIQESICSGMISMGHAKAILSAPTDEKRRKVAQKILQKKISVREAEKEASGVDTEKKEEALIYIKPLLDDIQQKLGTRVTMSQNDGRGQILIDFYNWEDLDRLLSLLRESSESV